MITSDPRSPRLSQEDAETLIDTLLKTANTIHDAPYVVSANDLRYAFEAAVARTLTRVRIPQ